MKDKIEDKKIWIEEQRANETKNPDGFFGNWAWYVQKEKEYENKG